MNEQKTEYVKVYIAGKEETDMHGVKVAGNEPWRNSKLLGSLLCSTKDIFHRIHLANIAFSTFTKVWLQGKRISLKRRIQVYEAQVVSVLLYGSCSWAAPKHVFERLNTTHRRHLRSILNITWPNIISNENLYKRCDVTPITERVDISRWTMLGHVLRLPENSPAALALVFAIDGCSAKSRRGRHQVNLFNTIKSDLVLRGYSLSNIDDLYVLRDVAKDRKKWRSLYDV